ncbi:MAG TPA: EAL domain-containing protein [Gaiellaceae bacterium]|nr:EAL domain-containing protein [Gaiellaceae bacterium]
MSGATRPEEIRVLIVDDEPAVRSALAACLALEPLFALAGSAASAEEAVALAAETRPDVALVDFGMPGGGHEAVRGILERSPATRVVALSGSSERQVVLEMLRAGATSYLVKGVDIAVIAETVLRSASGASILAPEVAASVLGELTSHLDRQACAQVELPLGQLVRDIIREGRVQPVFQPIVDLRRGVPVGYEALSRFDAEPFRPPDRWLADAECVGMRTELELVAARIAVTRFRSSGTAGYLALNASAATLGRCHELVEELETGRVVFEITEHHAIEDYQALRPVLDRLRAQGARLAVDDAGAGFASLRHALQLAPDFIKLAPDFIKLDISLIRGIDGNRRQRALASGLISFASDVGATIVAEGIETEGELASLRELGVDYGQGYYLARPALLADVRSTCGT